MAGDWEYCPECDRNYGGALYPEQQTSQERADIDRVAAIIRAAFHDVKLEDGTTLHEADLEGAYTDDRERIAAREKDPERDWKEVPDWKIATFHSALHFLDSKGWRFYIPAYMIWTLRNWRTTVSHTGNAVIWGFVPNDVPYVKTRFAILSVPQAEAVYEFLKFFCEYSGEPEPRNAIQAYWHRFAPTVL